MVQALEGVKVLDVSQLAAVPMAARHLADFGADVIHVEHPVRGDGWRGIPHNALLQNVYALSDIDYIWETTNRNKRSITIDLSQEAGQKAIYRIAEKADVFMTNLRAFEQERYKLEYDTLKKLNPRLIYGSLTGYGSKGAGKNEPGYDYTSYWARAGMPHMLSFPGVPCTGFRAAYGDHVAATTLFAGIMTALYAREKTGRGQRIDLSLFHTGVYQLSIDIAGALVTGKDYADWVAKIPDEMVAQADAIHDRIADYFKAQWPDPLAVPWPYKTKDGRLLSLAMRQSDLYWSKFCKATGREELEHDDRFHNVEARANHRAELYYIVKEVLLSRTFDEWIARFKEIPFAPFQNLIEAVNDPHARENGVFVPFDHPTYGKMLVIASPFQLSETPASIRTRAPEFSEHTEEVLLEHGYTWEEIARLKEQKTIS